MDGAAIRLLVLKTNQLDRLFPFYRALGIEFTEERHGSGPPHFATIVGNVVFELYPTAADRIPDNTTRLGFNVTNLHDVMATLQSLGTHVLAPAKVTDWGYGAIVHDPDGRVVELYQW